MFEINSSIGNFSDPKHLLLEMKYLKIDKVNIKARYCLNDILEATMTIEEVENWIKELEK